MAVEISSHAQYRSSVQSAFQASAKLVTDFRENAKNAQRLAEASQKQADTALDFVKRQEQLHEQFRILSAIPLRFVSPPTPKDQEHNIDNTASQRLDATPISRKAAHDRVVNEQALGSITTANVEQSSQSVVSIPNTDVMSASIEVTSMREASAISRATEKNDHNKPKSASVKEKTPSSCSKLKQTSASASAAKRNVIPSTKEALIGEFTKSSRLPNSIRSTSQDKPRSDGPASATLSRSRSRSPSASGKARKTTAPTTTLSRGGAEQPGRRRPKVVRRPLSPIKEMLNLPSTPQPLPRSIGAIRPKVSGKDERPAQTIRRRVKKSSNKHRHQISKDSDDDLAEDFDDDSGHDDFINDEVDSDGNPVDLPGMDSIGSNQNKTSKASKLRKSERKVGSDVASARASNSFRKASTPARSPIPAANSSVNDSGTVPGNRNAKKGAGNPSYMLEVDISQQAPLPRPHEVEKIADRHNKESRLLSTSAVHLTSIKQIGKKRSRDEGSGSHPPAQDPSIDHLQSDINTEEPDQPPLKKVHYDSIRQPLSFQATQNNTSNLDALVLGMPGQKQASGLGEEKADKDSDESVEEGEIVENPGSVQTTSDRITTLMNHEPTGIQSNNYNVISYANAVLQCIGNTIHAGSLQKSYGAMGTGKGLEGVHQITDYERLVVFLSQSRIDEKDVRFEFVNLMIELQKDQRTPVMSVYLHLLVLNAKIRKERRRYDPKIPERFDGRNVEDPASWLDILLNLLEPNASSSRSEYRYLRSHMLVTSRLINTCSKRQHVNYHVHYGYTLKIESDFKEIVPTRKLVASDISKDFATMENLLDRKKLTFVKELACGSCHKKKPVEVRWLGLSNVPSHLIVEFGRLTPRSDEKLWYQVTVPEEIDMGSYLVSRTETWYRLMAVVKHRGTSFQSGFCYAIIRRGKGWYHCNDDRIKRVSWEEVNRTDGQICLSFYERVERPSPPSRKEGAILIQGDDSSENRNDGDVLPSQALQEAGKQDGDTARKTVEQSDQDKQSERLSEKKTPNMGSNAALRAIPLKGLTNRSTMCYANAAMQCFLRSSGWVSFSRQLGEAGIEEPTQDGRRSGQTGSPAAELVRLTSEMMIEDRSVSLYRFQKTFAQAVEMVEYDNGSQQDAALYFRDLVNYVHEILFTKSDPYLMEQYGVLYQVLLKCLSCGHSEILDQPNNWTLNLHSGLDGVKDADSSENVTLRLNDLISGKQKPGNETSQCPQCKQRAERTWIGIKDAPKSLVIQLERAAFDKTRQIDSKLKYLVEFPDTLDFRANVAGSEDRKARAMYELESVIKHKGNTLRHGHYVAITRSSDQKWFLLDDSKVREITDADVGGSKYGQPYMLFYRMKSTSNLKPSTDVRVSENNEDLDPNPHSGRSSSAPQQDSKRKRSHRDDGTNAPDNGPSANKQRKTSKTKNNANGTISDRPVPGNISLRRSARSQKPTQLKVLPRPLRSLDESRSATSIFQAIARSFDKDQLTGFDGPTKREWLKVHAKLEAGHAVIELPAKTISGEIKKRVDAAYPKLESSGLPHVDIPPGKFDWTDSAPGGVENGFQAVPPLWNDYPSIAPKDAAVGIDCTLLNQVIDQLPTPHGVMDNARDPAQILNALLNGLEIDYAGDIVRSDFLRRLFQVDSETQWTCLRCHIRTSDNNEAWSLKLSPGLTADIRKKRKRNDDVVEIPPYKWTLNELMKKATESVVEAHYCDHCRAILPATREWKLVSLPERLIIHLDRKRLSNDKNLEYPFNSDVYYNLENYLPPGSGTAQFRPHTIIKSFSRRFQSNQYFALIKRTGHSGPLEWYKCADFIIERLTNSHDVIEDDNYSQTSMIFCERVVEE